MSKLFALADVNNFYVSCERVFQPELNNRPVIILSNNDGCAVARSNEAKLLGIKMGAPLHQIKHLVKQHNIAVRSSNYVLYGDMSNRFVSLLNTFTDQIEVYSIDECFLGFEGFEHIRMTPYAQKIVQAVKQGLGLPICIGLAPTKTLTKVANHYAKTLRVPGGVLNLSSSYTQKNALEKFPVGEIWGIGRRISAKLNDLGVQTALELRDADMKTMRRHFSVNIERTILELRGHPCIELDEVPEPKQQIICTRSFGQKIKDEQTLREAIAYHVTRGCASLREQGSVARCLTVGIRTNPFSKNDKQYMQSITMQLPAPSENTATFLECATRALKRIYRPGFLYKKAGIMLTDLCSKDTAQEDLFHYNIENPKLMPALDAINARFGKGALNFGSEGVKRAWVMNSNKRSREYTTKWSDIVVAH